MCKGLNMVDFNRIKTIGIVGFSPDMQKDSYQVGHYLLDNCFEVFPIYPKGECIAGQKVYHSVSALLEHKTIDCLVLFRNAKACFNIAQEIMQLHKTSHITLPHVFWMQLHICNPDIHPLFAGHNITIIEDKCIMIEHKKHTQSQHSKI